LSWEKLLPVTVPLLLAIGGSFGWFIKARSEGIRRARERLWPERRELYLTFLDPFIRHFHALSISDEKEQEKAAGMLLTYEFRRASFEMILISSDEVVRAYSRLMKEAFRGESGSGMVMLEHWSRLLLKLREGLVEETGLNNWDMIRWMTTDIDDYIDSDGKVVGRIGSKTAKA